MTNRELEEFNKTRKIWQICGVTSDLERTMQQWVDKLKIGPWKVRSFNSENMDWEYVDGRMLDKEKEPWEFRIGITMVGDFEIELIQPVKGPTIFQDWLDRHGEGIHHFKEKIADEAELQKTVEEWTANGVPSLEGGKFFSDIHHYMDTEKYIGCIYELGNCPFIVVPEGMTREFPYEDEK